MQAATAYQNIKDIHEAVMSDQIDLDASSQVRMVQMLLKMAEGMLSDQRSCGGDPSVTISWVAHMEDAEGTLTEAIQELQMDMDAYGRRIAQIRRAYLAGDHAMKYELNERV